MKVYYPPKPTLITITQPLFSQLELDDDKICEPKYNGDNLILKRFPDRYEFWNRYGFQMKRFKPPRDIFDQLDSIEWKGNCVLNGELIHFHTTNVKNRIVIFDMYEWNGDPTTNLFFKNRRQRLEERFKPLRDLTTRIGLRDDYRKDRLSTPIVVLAPQWIGGIRGHFRKIYDQLVKYEEIEGLVIKSLSAKVILGRSESPVVSYMFKVRKPGPTYRF